MEDGHNLKAVIFSRGIIVREEGERGYFKQKMSFGKCLPSANCRYVFGFQAEDFFS